MTSHSATRHLHLAGLAGVGLYAAAAVFFRVDAASGVREAFRWVLVLGLLAAFAVAYRAVRRLPESLRGRRIVAGYAVALAVTAAVVPAFQSNDLYIYVNIGWQQAGYGVNPYQTLLYEMPTGLTDPMFWQEWQFVPCTYGFLFALESWAALAISGPDHGLAVFVLKAVAVIGFLLLSGMIWLGGRSLGREYPTRHALLVAWNPLMLLHGVSNAHNDVLFALGVAVAVVAFLRGWWLVVFPALVAAALVKYLSVLAVPFVLLAAVRRFGWTRTAVSCLAGLLLAVACWWPYRDGFDASYFERTGKNLSATDKSLATIALWPVEVLKLRGGVEQILPSIVKAAGWFAFAVVVGAAFVRRVRDGNGGGEALARDCVLVLLAAILASSKYHSWYLLMLLPLAVWLPAASRLRQAALALGVANLLSFTFVYHSHLLNAVLILLLPLVHVWRRNPMAQSPRSDFRLQLPDSTRRRS
ncbi:hypothetical protein [Limnoglobus roseus]|uniref:DUF2029 domain-containing protein n=1 Tax=Limnoglobus roseus TaxID=2598579 RepID=A0A5C1A9H7_9BACT|nr:hypothetical protein [Limnoglobus roseus]QEL14462.1 hypothetical protein PX52LOC_01350 [Limnoglobus roseus]